MVKACLPPQPASVMLGLPLGRLTCVVAFERRPRLLAWQTFPQACLSECPLSVEAGSPWSKRFRRGRKKRRCFYNLVSDITYPHGALLYRSH